MEEMRELISLSRFKALLAASCLESSFVDPRPNAKETGLPPTMHCKAIKNDSRRVKG